MKRNSVSVLSIFTLYIVTIASQLANILYQAYVGQSPILPMLLPSIMLLTLLTVPAIIIGFRLGPELGLSIFHSHRSCNDTEKRTALIFTLTSSVLLGILLLVLRWVLLPYLPETIPDYGFRGFIGGTLVSIGAAVGEEVWFRFGLMTVVLWLVKKVFKLDLIPAKLALTVIIIIAFLFGLAHLPQLTSVGADTQFAIWATILGNVAVGSLYGWCFWRYGLLYAIIAHFSLDIVLHALPALF